MKTFLGNNTHSWTRGMLYLCEYDHEMKTITVMGEIQFESAFECLETYANTPNPASQMASGKDRESFEKDLQQLHNNLNDPKWVRELAEVL